jgi:phosphohistidine phosphatase SixA
MRAFFIERRMHFRRVVLAGFVLAAMVAACGGDDGQPAQRDAPPVQDDPVVFIVRHAETGSTAADPSLDVTGQARAQALATKLAGEGITAVLTSQYKRTQETGQPTAAAAGLTVTVKAVTGANAATYGNELKAAVGTAPGTAVLIVGHSNTVPETVKAFTGMDVTPIAESEYNRFYTITLASDGAHLEASTY